jgi:hypothetical protein
MRVTGGAPGPGPLPLATPRVALPRGSMRARTFLVATALRSSDARAKPAAGTARSDLPRLDPPGDGLAIRARLSMMRLVERCIGKRNVIARQAVADSNHDGS